MKKDRMGGLKHRAVGVGEFQPIVTTMTFEYIFLTIGAAWGVVH